MASTLTLQDLLASSEQRDWLRAKRIFTEQDEFVTSLTAPRNPALAVYLDTGSTPLIWAGQQTYVDPTQSVLNRMRLLAGLEATGRVSPFWLWLDTDRTGSEPRITRFSWPSEDGDLHVRLSPQKTSDIEARFVTLDPASPRNAIARLEGHLGRTGDLKKMPPHFQTFKSAFVEQASTTLASLNTAISQFLIDRYASLQLRYVMMSDLLHEQILIPEVNRLLNALSDVIAVVNETREALAKAGIDPVIPNQPDDWLPLNVSCPVDWSRLRLRHVIDQGNHFAAATCNCGIEYRFYLGRSELSLGEVAAAHWSLDVFVTAILDGLVSGYVSGYSSGMYYGLVMGATFERVFGTARVPILVPPNLHTGDLQHNSLIYSFIMRS